MKPITKQEVVDYIEGNYNEEDVQENVQSAIHDYLDEDWEDEFDDEQSAYEEQGRGEAEDQVKGEIIKDVLTHFFSEYGYDKTNSIEDNQIYFDRYKSEVGEEVWDTIHEVFDFLNK